jgi:hypothetical protein
MSKGGFVWHASMFHWYKRICYRVQGTVQWWPCCLAYACSCLSVFVIISRFGKVVEYVKFPNILRNVGSGA